MARIVGFGRQSRIPGSCSRFAIRHALLCLAVTTNEAELSQALGRRRPHLRGLDESFIKRAVAEYDCRPIELWHSSAARWRSAADELLEQGAPLIACVKDWDHWVVVAGRHRGGYLVIDSDRRPLVGRGSFRDLSAWLRCSGEADPFYAIGVRPRRRSQLLRSLVPNLAAVAQHISAGPLARDWGIYLDQLLTLFDAGPKSGVTAESFFTAHRAAILEAAGRRRLRGRPATMAAELDRYRLIAWAHRLRISKRRVKEAGAVVATWL